MEGYLPAQTDNWQRLALQRVNASPKTNQKKGEFVFFIIVLPYIKSEK